MKTVALIQFFMICMNLCSCLTTVSKDTNPKDTNPNVGKSLKVEMVSPRGGEKVHGKMSIQAAVNKADEVRYVDFYFQELGAQDRYSWKAYSSPYFWGGEGEKLDTTLFNDGPASAVAFCYPKDSRLPIEQSRVHFMIDNGKPKVKILSPADDASVKGNVLIRVDAKDLKGIERDAGVVAVYIYVDGGLLQKLTKPPFLATLNTCLFAPGLHSIRVVAEDTEGLSSTDSIMVRVGHGGSALGNKNSIKP